MGAVDTASVSATAVGEITLSESSTKWPGLSRKVLETKNQMSYSAADAIAAAYGGDVSLVPKFIGFVYGPEQDPQGLSASTDRDMGWDALRSQVAGVHGNVQVARFSVAPYVEARSDEAGRYTGNSVVFQACTRSGAAGEYAFDASGESEFGGEMGTQSYIYQALLLGIPPGQECVDEKRYLILARASLARGGSYRRKPEGYELALSWRVTFY